MLTPKPGDTYEGQRIVDVENEGNNQFSLDLEDGRVVVVDGLTHYRVGIVYLFWAEDESHAIEQLVDMLGGEDALEDDHIRNSVNVLEEATPTLQDALTAHVQAMETLAKVACEEIEAKVKEKFPDAAWARVTAIVNESYTEHGIEVYDAENNRLDDGQSWPLDDEEDEGVEDWFLAATEGACGFEEYTTIAFGAPE